MDALPSDPQAEAVLLRRATYGGYDDDLAGLLLSSWQHRACWQAVLAARSEHDAGQRAIAFGRAMCAALCGSVRHHVPWSPGDCRAWSVWEGVEREAGDEGAADDNLRCALPGCRRPVGHPPHAAPNDYWLGRLQECVEARRLIEIAQDIATHAWKRDLARARLLVGHGGVPKPEVPKRDSLEDLLELE